MGVIVGTMKWGYVYFWFGRWEQSSVNQSNPTLECVASESNATSWLRVITVVYIQFHITFRIVDYTCIFVVDMFVSWLPESIVMIGSGTDAISTLYGRALLQGLMLEEYPESCSRVCATVCLVATSARACSWGSTKKTPRLWWVAEPLSSPTTVPGSLLFVPQVHPTPKSQRSPSLGLHYFEFAGQVVGKCIFESAMGNSMLVKAHFTRSFLAQIIGLRVTWKVTQKFWSEKLRAKNHLKNKKTIVV